jgi:hypothetical protein
VAERQQFPLGLNIWYVIQVVGVNNNNNNNNTLLKRRVIQGYSKHAASVVGRYFNP